MLTCSCGKTFSRLYNLKRHKKFTCVENKPYGEAILENDKLSSDDIRGVATQLGTDSNDNQLQIDNNSENQLDDNSVTGSDNISGSESDNSTESKQNDKKRKTIFTSDSDLENSGSYNYRRRKCRNQRHENNNKSEEVNTSEDETSENEYYNSDNELDDISDTKSDNIRGSESDNSTESEQNAKKRKALFTSDSDSEDSGRYNCCRRKCRNKRHENNNKSEEDNPSEDETSENGDYNCDNELDDISDTKSDNISGSESDNSTESKQNAKKRKALFTSDSDSEDSGSYNCRCRKCRNKRHENNNKSDEVNISEDDTSENGDYITTDDEDVALSNESGSVHKSSKSNSRIINSQLNKSKECRYQKYYVNQAAGGICTHILPNFKKGIGYF